MSIILLTNAKHYAGPGALTALTAGGAHVICHDSSFWDRKAREQFEEENSGAKALKSQSPEEILDEVASRLDFIDGIVSNDVYPITQNEIEAIPLKDLRQTFEAVVMFPIRLTQLFLHMLKARRRGSFVFITSARESRPEIGYAVPTTMRAATTAFAKALAKESAPFGVQVKRRCTQLLV